MALNAIKVTKITQDINRPRFLQHWSSSFVPDDTVLFSKIQDH
jgi:hypothetical protein